MSNYTVSLLQASFYSTPIISRCLIHPVDVQKKSPDARSWKAVNDEILSQVPSKSLLSLTVKDLTRQLNWLAMQHINGWVFNAQRAILVKNQLQNASSHYKTIRDGVFADELKSVIRSLLSRNPRFQARLSEKDSLDEAVEEVTGRALSHCRFTWEMSLFTLLDKRSFGIRLMALMFDELYRLLESQNTDGHMMLSRKFTQFDRLADRLGQFAGVDPRFDQALADYKQSLRCLPNDGSPLYEGGLKEFWQELTRLGDYLKNELQSDFYEQPTITNDFNEDSLHWDVDADNTIDDLIVWEQCDIDTGVSITSISDLDQNNFLNSDPFNI